MRIPGLKTLKEQWRMLRSRTMGSALILGYHRVADLQQDLYGTSISTALFSEQMEYLAKHLQPITLSDLVQSMRAGEIPLNAVVVTFDDGYSDTLHQALPVLEAFKIPATVFVATGFMGKIFWWDELNALLDMAFQMQRPFRIEIGQVQFEWSGSDEDTALPVNIGGFKRKVYRSLLVQAPDLIEHSLDALRSQILKEGEHTLEARRIGRGLSTAELRELNSSKWISIGSHTISHPILTNLSAESQHKEMTMSKRKLEEILGEPVVSFSYPNGRSDARLVELLKQTGFSHACRSFPDGVSPHTPIFELPRLWPSPTGKSGFSRWIGRWH